MSIRDAGIALVRRFEWLDGFARWIYLRLPSTLHDTPTTFLRQLFHHAPAVQFVQIGAFDGVAGDPIGEIVAADARWRGVLIEPQPKVFDRLVANYSAQADRLVFLQCAVSSESGNMPFYSVPPSEIERLDLPDWAGEVASFDRNHVEKHFPQAKIDKTDVSVRSLTSIVDDLDIQQVDLVVMDVEGHERTIIESIDWVGLGVKACIFEHKHMASAELAALEALFSESGFKLKRYGRDMVAYKELRPNTK